MSPVNHFPFGVLAMCSKVGNSMKHLTTSGSDSGIFSSITTWGSTTVPLATSSILMTSDHALHPIE